MLLSENSFLFQTLKEHPKKEVYSVFIWIVGKWALKTGAIIFKKNLKIAEDMIFYLSSPFMQVR